MCLRFVSQGPKGLLPPARIPTTASVRRFDIFVYSQAVLVLALALLARGIIIVIAAAPASSPASSPAAAPVGVRAGLALLLLLPAGLAALGVGADAAVVLG